MENEDKVMEKTENLYIELEIHIISLIFKRSIFKNLSDRLGLSLVDRNLQEARNIRKNMYMDYMRSSMMGESIPQGLNLNYI